VAGLRRLARELAAERPDLFDPARLPSDAAAPAGGDTDDAGAPPDPSTIAPLVEMIADGRAQARRAKDWVTGDRVRARLAELGVLLEDAPDGVTWRVR
jgi:cysteinyl-tRNA synthetase